MFDLSAKALQFRFREIREDKKFYLYHFLRLPTWDDWTTFLKSKSFLGYSKGAGTFELANVSQEEDASFWNDLVLKVEGYKFAGDDLMKQSDWKEKVPLAHKLEVIGAFLLFNRTNAPIEEAVVSEGFDVSEVSFTDITASVLFGGKEEYITFTFKTPQSSDYVKYNRMASKMLLVRTKQRNISTVKAPVNLQLSEDLFNRLIEKVSGYICEDKDVMILSDWKSLIPLYHKREAIRELFTGSLREDEQD